MSSYLPVQSTKVVVGVDVVRRVPDGGQKVLLSNFGTVQQRAQIIVCTGIAWPQPERLVVVPRGRFRLARVAQKITKIVVHFGIVWKHIEAGSVVDERKAAQMLVKCW